ncbi:hypothetical protein LRP88_14147 [Fusarium phalaenopsidis]
MPTTTEYLGYTITNLGPLTTTYTAPAECATATDNIQFVQADLPWIPGAWGYPSCVPGDYGKCIPSGDAYDKLAKEHANTWHGYTGDNFLNCHSVMGPITELGYTEGCIHTWPGKAYTDVTATFEGVESPYLSKIKNTAEPGTAYWTKTALTVEEENIAVATKVPAVALVYQSLDLEKAKATGESKNAAAAPLSVRGMVPVVAVVLSMLAGSGLLVPW